MNIAEVFYFSIFENRSVSLNQAASDLKIISNSETRVRRNVRTVRQLLTDRTTHERVGLFSKVTVNFVLPTSQSVRDGSPEFRFEKRKLLAFKLLRGGENPTTVYRRVDRAGVSSNFRVSLKVLGLAVSPLSSSMIDDRP